MDERERFDRLTDEIIGSAIEVHRSLGPGLLESACETCLAYELGERGFNVERQKSLPVIYREVKLEAGYRLDLLVNGLVIVEVKAVERLLPIHDAQLISYLRLSGCSLGLRTISKRQMPCSHPPALKGLGFWGHIPQSPCQRGHPLWTPCTGF